MALDTPPVALEWSHVMVRKGWGDCRSLCQGDSETLNLSAFLTYVTLYATGRIEMVAADSAFARAGAFGPSYPWLEPQATTTTWDSTTPRKPLNVVTIAECDLPLELLPIRPII